MFVGGNPHRLLGPLPLLISEPNYDWSREFLFLALRAQELVCNDPFAAAMVEAKIQNTHGPTGLRLRSLADLDDDATTSDDERDLRRRIEELIERNAGHTFDASGLLTRREMERQIDWMATVLGEGWAVRVLLPGRPRAELATCWRLIRPERIGNPDNAPNDDRLYHGLEMDAKGQLVAIHVRRYNITSWGVAIDQVWDRIPIIAPDGTLNVVRRNGLMIPGMLRSVSMFAPTLLLSKQTRGTIEAYVTAKRAQACTPILYDHEDPELAAKEGTINSNAVLGPHTKFEPLGVIYKKTGSTVTFTDFKFNGADMKDFFTVAHRICCAQWQLPVEVVLAQMGEASLSSARAGLDQMDRTCQNWQNDHIDAVSRPLDESLIREAVARGDLPVGASGIPGLCCGRYSRPPKYSTDRYKDSEAAKGWIDLGRSKTSVFAEYGYDFEDETEERARDDEFAETQGVEPEAPAPVPPPLTAQPPDAQPPADDEAEPNPAQTVPAGAEDAA